ncbi:SusC/RagA family TonB-linked outer membrane protein [Pedobacter glucosidilyticus]|uniref:SusC/RagA family TonB-linked outer membrane protein n=1 Tax=Pedobacter glucosidilyticus TaxID=1122941 RepID=UPI0004215D8A|nr:TonB-dependent receptor [Pedobacter glucosidilyticus]
MKKSLQDLSYAMTKACCFALLLLFYSNATSFAFENNNKKILYLADRIITGKVVDEQGETLPGVNIVLRGTKISTVSDLNGNFTLKIPSTETSKILDFSYLGYEKQQLTIGQSNSYKVVLNTESKSLNEVVVIGYGSVAKKDLTGSVATVNVDELAKAPVQSFDQALAGRVAGVQVSSSDGQPGSEGISIVIRGANSLTQGNGPLYVVDGFPLDDFNTSSLDPKDIASITVLKDASSTAIYGARGANGVIVIETKKGIEGAPVLNYSSSFGTNEIIRTIPMMNGYEYIKYQIEKRGTSVAVAYTPGDLDPSNPSYVAGGKTLEDYRNGPQIDWQDELFKTGSTQIHNLSVRGGTKDTKYAISGSIFNQEGVIINSGSRRYQGRISLDQNINKKLKAGVNINYSNNLSNGQDVATGGGFSSTAALMFATWGFRPVPSPGTETQDYIDDLLDDEIDGNNDYRINPIISAKNELREVRTNNIITNAFATYNFSKDLVLRVQGGLNNRSARNDNFYNTKTSRGTPLLPNNIRGVQGSIIYNNLNIWSNENTLTFNKKINKNTFNIIGGTSLQGQSTERYGQSSILIPIESLGISGIDLGIPQPSVSSQAVSNLMSFFGRVNYNYNYKYYLSATMRADASSRFAPENRWGYFPSGAFSWRMSSENFMKKIKFISDAKLRVSYGLAGNNRVSDYAYVSAFNFPIASSYSFNNGTPALGAVPTELSNFDLKWETTRSLDIGYDLALLNNRIELTLDWYDKVTRDLLLNADIPFTSGYPNAFRNIGSVRNTGFEIGLNTVNLKKGKFEWTSNFNISFNDNKILSLNKDQDFILSSLPWDNIYRNNFLYVGKVGEPAAQFFGFIFDGIYQYTDFDEVSPGNYLLKPGVPTNGNPRQNIRPGEIRYKDLNGDLIVDAADQTVIGRTLPKHIGGFINNFSYAGFNLSVFLQWSYGNQIYNANRLLFEAGLSNSTNQFASYIERWTPTNPSNTLPGVNGRGPNGVYSSRVIEDGSFLRLKTVSLDYSLPRKLTSKLKLGTINLSASAQNLYTWTKYSGFDPEVAVRNSTLTPGFDFSSYPRARTIVFGINVKF